MKDEIEKGGDELTEWIQEKAPKGFFLHQNAEVMTKLAETIIWAKVCLPLIVPTLQAGVFGDVLYPGLRPGLKCCALSGLGLAALRYHTMAYDPGWYVASLQGPAGCGNSRAIWCGVVIVWLVPFWNLCFFVFAF